jgi:hypothetical protein
MGSEFTTNWQTSVMVSSDETFPWQDYEILHRRRGGLVTAEIRGGNKFRGH